MGIYDILLYFMDKATKEPDQNKTLYLKRLMTVFEYFNQEEIIEDDLDMQ